MKISMSAKVGDFNRWMMIKATIGGKNNGCKCLMLIGCNSEEGGDLQLGKPIGG